MSEELKNQESRALGILLAIVDGSVDPTFREAPSPNAALEALQELAKKGPIHPGALTRVYMEGQNALLLQLGSVFRFALSLAGWDINGTCLEPMSPVAAQYRDELYARMEQMAKEAAEAAQAQAQAVQQEPEQTPEQTPEQPPEQSHA